MKTNMVNEVKHASTFVAESILDKATKIVASRSKQHGDTEASFLMIAELWSAYISHKSIVVGGIKLDASDVAQMQVLVKMARSVYGDGMDNYVDGAGYTALAGMLQGKYPEKEGNHDTE